MIKIRQPEILKLFYEGLENFVVENSEENFHELNVSRLKAQQKLHKKLKIIFPTEKKNQRRKSQIFYVAECINGQIKYQKTKNKIKWIYSH